MRRMFLIMWKELLELRQDPRLFGIIFVAPVLQLTLLGYAASTDVRNVPVVVVDADGSAASRQLISRFEGSPYFTVVGRVSSVQDVDPWLADGRAWMALAIPSEFAELVEQGLPATVQVIADGSDSNSTTVALGYAANLVVSYSEELAISGSAGGVGAAATSGRPIEARIRVWFNPQLESRDFMVPGILALLLLVITTNLSSMAIVREKELGTLEQLNVTPVTRAELIIGKLLPYGAIGILDVLLVMAVAIFWFEIPLRGSVWLLLGCSVIYLLTTLGLGLFVSTISGTQQQAMMTASFFILTPMMFLSGFVFPIENMPRVIQPVTFLIPIRYYLIIVRGIFLKGVGLSVLWPQIAALFAWGIVILALSVARSRKTLA
jgi:ABC-2 type transport system permease protein